MKEKLIELNDIKFNQWMEINYSKERLEKRMLEVANNGYTGIHIEVTEERHEESKLMKLNTKFLKLLKEMFPDLDVREIEYTKTSYDLWTSRFYDVNHKRIEISWRSENKE